MKKYVKSTSDIESYKNYKIGQEDSGDQRFYFQYGAGKFCYAPTIEELKSKIDKWIKDKDDSEFIRSASAVDARSIDRMSDDLDIVAQEIRMNVTEIAERADELTNAGLKFVLEDLEKMSNTLRRDIRLYLN